MKRPILLALALLCPLLILGGQAASNIWKTTSGTEVVLPIQGFDPRNLLSGHYLQYRIDFGIENLCESQASVSWVCLDPRKEFLVPPGKNQCSQFIVGSCDTGRFSAGIERFYVPEAEALALERAVIRGAGSVILSVQDDGTTLVKDLLIEGKPWRELDTD